MTVPFYDKNMVDSVTMETLQDYWIDLANREMWIRGIEESSSAEIEGAEPGVEYMMATRTIMNLNALRLKGSEEVLVHMHTCGGLWEEGMAIYDTISAMPYKVTILSYTHARSMSSLILQAADERLLMPSSYVMLHYGTLAFDGEATTVLSNIERAKYDSKRMLDIYVDSMTSGRKFKDWTEEAVRKFLVEQLDKKSDVFLTPREAINWGLADGIFEKWTPGKRRIVKKR